MRTCLIIGAGLTGLVAARRLADLGWHPLLIDKGRAPGGRLATRRVAGLACDHGAQFITVRDPAFAALVAQWEQAGVLARWCDGFPVLRPGGVLPPDGHPRWMAPGGFRALAAHLAQGLDLRQHTTVTRLERAATGWSVTIAQGDAVRGEAGPEEQVVVDAVISTLPGPQATGLLQASGLTVPSEAQHIAYHPCHALMLAWPDLAGPVLPAPGGARIEDPALPLGWVASQRAKGLIPRGDVLLAHSLPGWSAKAWDQAPDAQVPPLLAAIRTVLERLGGTWPGEPAEIDLHRWKFSVPIRCAPEAVVRVPSLAPLILAGDGCGDRPRVEGAALSGLAAAEALVA